MTLPLKILVAKLNDSCRLATQRAAALCVGRGHYEVEPEHLLLGLLDDDSNDVALACRRAGIDTRTVRDELERELARLRTGNGRTPVFGPQATTLLEQAWLIASVDSTVPRIRSAHLLVALLTEPGLAQRAPRSCPTLATLPLEELRHRADAWLAGSNEATVRASTDATAGAAAASGSSAAADAAGVPSSSAALDQFTVDLTRRAREGGLDPVVGRDAEIRQTIDVLMRRRQNNPILTGDAGVGKTAIVEGLALRIAAGDVPPALRAVELRMLDLGLLQAGAGVRGEFEQRLKGVIDAVAKSPRPVVLFIDEAHTLIGAGGAAGQNDAANLLKPALARGGLRTIAATTWAEYRRYFEKDAALARRFQQVQVEEPDETIAAAMLRVTVPLMERHFGVRVLDEAITEAVRLSARYIPARQLPDKAVGVLDTACARVALARATLPAAIEDDARALERVDAESAALARDAGEQPALAARRAELAEQRRLIEQRLDGLQARHRSELALVQAIEVLRNGPGDEAATQGPAAPVALPAKLDELAVLQGDTPLVPMQVDGRVVAEVVSAWSGVPLARMLRDDIAAVRSLEQTLAERVIGQPHALATIARRVRTASARLEDPRKPRGVFLLAGPSGVGKTETARALADALHGGARRLVTLNMNEYQEAHAVSGLKGSPPGYVGYGEGGVLTEAVRRNPHAVLLFDEIEKAHADVLELLFQVLDQGEMDDAEGRRIDFRHTLILLASNAGSAVTMQACLGKPEAERPTPEQLVDLLRPALCKAFKPAFVARVQVVPYYPLDDAALARVIRLKLDRIAERVATQHRARFDYDTRAVQALLERCTAADSGARDVDHLIEGLLLPRLADEVLSRLAEGAALQRVRLSALKSGEFRYTVA